MDADSLFAVLEMQVYPLPGLEEPVGSLTHLVGALIFTALLVPLVRRGRGDALRVGLLTVYGFSCVFLLAMSGIYHMMPEGTADRAAMGRMDRAAIFILIAGTHTPVQGIFFRGLARWGVIAVMWGLALTGIILFTAFFEQMTSGLVTAVYILLGWVAGSAGLILWQRLGTAEIVLLLGGGIIYSAGAILMGLEWPIVIPGVVGPHEVWHFAVLTAMAMHWVFLFKNARQDMDPPAEVVSLHTTSVAS
jgi:channel protein (hemolysin III family)